MTRLRLAITGARGAGKTVFLTSLLNHLLDGSPQGLPSFAEKGVLFTARERPLPPDHERFPYETYIESFRQPDPAWPPSTTLLSEFHLDLRIGRSGRSPRSIRLEIVDYPGERLVDMPMQRLSFAEWSAQAFQDLSHGPRAALSEPWRKSLENLDTLADSEDEPCRNAIAAYHAYLKECRGHGLEYLQPSAVLLDADAAGLDIEFCPLPPSLIEDCPSVARAFSERYQNYVEGYVRPFARAASSCSRQIVLVDVLRVLRQGVHAFNDTRRCLRNVLDVFGYAKPLQWYNPLDWGRWFFTSGREIERVAFIATKADQASRNSRPRLKDLLRELVRTKEQDIRLDLNAERLAMFFAAAVRCTTDAETDFHGQPLGLLQGRRADKPPDAFGPWFPGEAPGEWPSEAWNPNERQYRFPDFLPHRLPPRDGATFDHINLDKALWHVLEDLVP